MLYNRDYRTVLKTGRGVDRYLYQSQQESGIISGICFIVCGLMFIIIAIAQVAK